MGVALPSGLAGPTAGATLVGAFDDPESASFGRMGQALLASSPGFSGWQACLKRSVFDLF